MRDRGRLVLQDLAAHRVRSAALWTALFSLAAAGSVFLPWLRWDPGEGSWRFGGPHEFGDVLGFLHGYFDGAASHFLGRYIAILACAAAAAATWTAGSGGAARGRSSQARAAIALIALSGALALTVVDLVRNPGLDLPAPSLAYSPGQGWRRSVGPWATLFLAASAAMCALVLVLRTRGQPMGESGALTPPRAATVAAVCGLGVAIGVFLPWYGAASEVDRPSEIVQAWSGFGFAPLGLAVVILAAVGCATSVRLVSLPAAGELSQGRAAGRAADQARDAGRFHARVALVSLGLAAVCVLVDWVWFYRVRGDGYGLTSVAYVREWGLHFTAIVAAVGLAAARGAWRSAQRSPSQVRVPSRREVVMSRWERGVVCVALAVLALNALLGGSLLTLRSRLSGVVRADTVMARELRILDKEGRDRALLVVASDGDESSYSLLQLADARGAPRAILRVDSDGSPTLRFLDRDGKETWIAPPK